MLYRPGQVESEIQLDKMHWMVRSFFAFLSLQEHDEPILKHLEDIKVKFSDPGQPMVSESDSRKMAGRHSLCIPHNSNTLVLLTPPELHVRVPFFTQRLLHKHSVDKNLQDEVRARRVRPLLLRWTRDHELHRVSPQVKLYMPVFLLRDC